MKEATITIEGRELSYAEAMAVRVGLTRYLSDVYYGGLGEDERGKVITDLYINNTKSVLDTILKGTK